MGPLNLHTTGSLGITDESSQVKPMLDLAMHGYLIPTTQRMCFLITAASVPAHAAIPSPLTPSAGRQAAAAWVCRYRLSAPLLFSHYLFLLLPTFLPLARNACLPGACARGAQGSSGGARGVMAERRESRTVNTVIRK